MDKSACPNNDATTKEDERSTSLSEVRMTTDLDNTNNKKGVKQPSGVLRLDNEDVSGSLAALAEVAYVMAPQNQANGQQQQKQLEEVNVP
jgi:hypothetical protein